MPRFLIYGTFMRGQPGHANLEGAEYLEAVRTAPRYRLWEVDGRWPALVEDADGLEIAGELYEIPPRIWLGSPTSSRPAGFARLSNWPTAAPWRPSLAIRR